MLRALQIVIVLNAILLMAIPSHAAIPSAVSAPVVGLLDLKTKNLFEASYRQGRYGVDRVFPIVSAEKAATGIYRVEKLLGASTLTLLPSPVGRGGPIEVVDQASTRAGPGVVVVGIKELSLLNKLAESDRGYVLVFNSLNAELLNPGGDKSLQRFMDRWVEAWSSRNFDSYLKFYDPEFFKSEQERRDWRGAKRGVFGKYSSIRIGLSDVIYLKHPDYSLITFRQGFVAKTKVGMGTVRFDGIKRLYVAERAGGYRILSEEFIEDPN
jgi:hypothetical protein